MLVGSVANGLHASGGFCAGATHVVEHQVRTLFPSDSIANRTYTDPDIPSQRINGTSFVFSAATPALLAASGSEAISILRNTPSILSTLHENIRTIRSVLERIDLISVPSHAASPIILFTIRTPAELASSSSSSTLALPTASHHGPGKHSHSNPTSVQPRDAPEFDIEAEERLCQEVVDECMAQGVWINRAKRLRGQEWLECRPSVKICVTAGLSRKECEKAAGVIKAAVVKVLGRRR